MPDRQRPVDLFERGTRQWLSPTERGYELVKPDLAYFYNLNDVRLTLHDAELGRHLGTTITTEAPFGETF